LKRTGGVSGERFHLPGFLLIILRSIFREVEIMGNRIASERMGIVAVLAFLAFAPAVSQVHAGGGWLAGDPTGRPIPTTPPTVLPTPEDTQMPTETPSATPTDTPTPDASQTATTTPSPTPTSIPEPGKIWIDLVMSDTHLDPGDRFILISILGNDSEANVAVDEYIVLDIAGSYWFWPAWEPATDGMRINLPGSSAVSNLVLLFAWPYGIGNSSDNRFWGAVLLAGTDHVLSWDMIEWEF
jgi:hypothetical protein